MHVCATRGPLYGTRRIVRSADSSSRFHPSLPQSAVAGMVLSAVLLYLGKINGAAIAGSLALQLAWVVLLFAIGDAMWRWSSRKITIQGG